MEGEEMSIILKGIDLPEKNMRVICLFPNGAEELVVLDAESGATAGRPIHAIQIPKGHGRIIDENEAIRGWCEGCAFKDTEECADCKDKEMCKYAPTILEAEEDK